MKDRNIVTTSAIRTKQGLTLIEILVCVALLLVAVALLIPPLTSSTGDHTGRTRMLSNGRYIFMYLFSADLETLNEDPQGLSMRHWPSDDATSTAYFRRQMENGALPEDFSLFSAPGVPAASSRAVFSAENNAWSVVSGFSKKESHAQDPFLISRNLNEEALIDWAGDESRALKNIGPRGSRSEYTTPFRDEFLVVIRMGGGGEVLNKKSMRWHILNPNSLTHPILPPSQPSEQTAPGSDW